MKYGVMQAAVQLEPCVACGKMLSPHASVCPNCGQPVKVRQKVAEGGRIVTLIWGWFCTVPIVIGWIGFFLGRDMFPQSNDTGPILQFLWFATSLCLLVGWSPYLLFWIRRKQNGL